MGSRVLIRNKSIVIAGIFLTFAFYLIGCKATEKVVTEKSGAELWSQQCSRCHNMPDPTAYQDDKWETVSMHMKVRANISDKEIKLIKEFLQSANGEE